MSTLNDNCSILVTLLLLLLTIELFAQWSNCTPFNNLYMPKSSTNPFHAYNQYTVDQLLEKAPSVLEFAETSTITQNESDNDPSKLPNQNVFQSGNLNNSSSSHAIHSKKSKHPYLVNTKFKSLKTINQILSSIRFNCSGFPEGYYADLDFNCRIFHYCKRGMIKFTFNCPVNAIFNQKQLTCENNLRNPIKMCKSSTKYFFLNSMLYPNSNNNHNELSPISEQLKEPDHWMFDSTTELPLFSSTEMTFRPTTSQPKQLKRSKINKKNSKPKWSAVEMLNSFQQIPSPMAEIPMPTESTPTNPHENEPFSTAFSIWEPDIVSTSSPSPMDQIMAPKWYHDTVSVNDFTNIFDNNRNTNIYSLDSSSTSTEMEDNNNMAQSSTPSYLGLFDDIETSTISMDTKNNIKHKSNKKENDNDKFETKFNIDWDDAEMSAGEFSPIRINQRPKQHKPIFNQYSSTPPPDTDENNFLYGKPIEIPDNVINSNEFNPVSIESIMANIPQTTPEIDMGVSIIPNFYNYYNQNQPEHQNQNPLPALNKNSNNFFSQKMSALFNMLGNKIGRRWAKKGIVGNSRLSFPIDDFLLNNRRYELLDPNNIQLQNLQSQIHQYLPITTEQSIINNNNNNNKNRYSQLTWPQPSLFPSNNNYRNY